MLGFCYPGDPEKKLTLRSNEYDHLYLGKFIFGFYEEVFAIVY